MCGRFTLAKSQTEIADHFDALPHPSLPALMPRYNVAPSQTVAVVGLKPDGRSRGLVMLRWGLVPHWSSDGKPGPANARGETVATLPTFRESFRERRCLIPADGFYEWATEGKKKVPWRFTVPGSGLLALAGIWDVWKGGGETRVTCCLITTAANDTVRPLHDRMPVILPPECWAAWLSPDTPVPQLQALLRPYTGPMLASPANSLVNKVRNDGPELLAA